MKLHYYPDTDSLYLEFREISGSEVHVVTEGLNADIGSDGVLVGLDIDCASQRVELSRIEVIGMPLTHFTMT